MKTTEARSINILIADEILFIYRIYIYFAFISISFFNVMQLIFFVSSANLAETWTKEKLAMETEKDKTNNRQKKRKLETNC